MTQDYKDVTAHELVGEVAVAVAHEMYETLASDNNDWYKLNADRSAFIKRVAPMCKPIAIAALGKLLCDPGTSQMEKEKIYEALVLDNMLPKTGTSVVQKGTWH